MYPYLHLGHFTIGTFGLLLWLAAVCAGIVLHLNFRHFHVQADAIGGGGVYHRTGSSGREAVACL